MIPLFIGSLSEYAGKNMICLGLSMKFREDGFKTGYFKPIGVFPTREGDVITDEDTRFFRRALDLAEPVDTMCPVVLTEGVIQKVLSNGVSDALKSIAKAFKTVAKGKDVVLIGGMGDLDAGLAIGASGLQVVEKLGAKVILVTAFQNIYFCTDRCLAAKAQLGDRLVGVIFNRATRRQKEIVETRLRPFFASRKIDVLGIIGEDPMLGAVPIRSLVERLNAKLLCCEDTLDQLVERFSIGAMNVESALRFFQRQPNKAVIVGGDRPDIQLAALETSTRCLILTGDLYPNEIILGKAQEKDIPVLMVKTDTAATVDACEDLLGHLSLHSLEKLQRVSAVVNAELNLDLIYRKIGLKKRDERA